MFSIVWADKTRQNTYQKMTKYNTQIRNKQGELIEGTIKQDLIICQTKYKLVRVYNLNNNTLDRELYFPLLKGSPILNRQELVFKYLNPNE